MDLRNKLTTKQKKQQDEENGCSEEPRMQKGWKAKMLRMRTQTMPTPAFVGKLSILFQGIST